MKDMPGGTYAHFTFLREDLLLFPKMRLNVLEISKIIAPTSDSVPYLKTLRTLHLPELSLSAILRFACRAEPNPQAIATEVQATAASSESSFCGRQNRMFRDDPTSSIIIFHILLHGMGPQHLNPLDSFVFITHRSSLLSLIAPEELAHPFLCVETTMTEKDMTWGEWDGEMKTRWFETEQGGMLSMRWITTTAGMKWVVMAEGTQTQAADAGTVTVRDFNPHQVDEVYKRIGDGPTKVARAAAHDEGTGMLGAEGQEGKRPVVLTKRVVKEKTVLNTNGFFTQPLVSGLPYVETVTGGMKGYDGVLMDEQRIIGVQARIFPARLFSRLSSSVNGPAYNTYT